ncbi:MAG: NAD(P)-dependent oxidoreductase [Candidatus Omnitrophica bacterium]|nr:NAD(P)-dependent oxidoreductase [Candidatus Omnitrophota bacterium]
MNILVTGATGFIGRNLVEELVKNSANNVFCLVRNTSNLKLLKHLRVEFIYSDIVDFESLKKTVTKKFDVVFHCAAYVGNSDKDRLYRDNVLGAENIFRLSLELGVDKVIHLSSVAVATGNSQIPLTEDLPLNATNPYGISKVKAEKIALDYRTAGLNIALIRPTMVYGQREPHLMRLMLSLLKKRLYPLINRGKHKFHLVYVKTVVDALIFAMNEDRCLEGAYFVADKEVLTNKEAMTIMAEAIGAKPPWNVPLFLSKLVLKLPHVGNQLKFFQKDRQYSTQKLESLGFKFRYPAKESLVKSCQWFVTK